MTTNYKIEVTEAELKLLRLGLLAVEREDVHRGGSRDYHFEDQVTALKDKLREAGDE
jgi:hypothetical protein